MSEQELNELLQEVICLLADMSPEDLGDTGLMEADPLMGSTAMNLEQGGYLTSDTGFELRLASGEKFLIKIQRAK